MSRSSVARLGLLLALLALLASCSRDLSAGLSMPVDSPLGSGLGWGVVRDSYARLKAEPDPAAEDLAQLRDGTLVEILGREFPRASSSDTSLRLGARPSRQAWYRVRPAVPQGSAAPPGAMAGEDPGSAPAGWLAPESLERFERRAQAERRLAELRR